MVVTCILLYYPLNWFSNHKIHSEYKKKKKLKWPCTNIEINYKCNTSRKK